MEKPEEGKLTSSQEFVKKKSLFKNIKKKYLKKVGNMF
jgi:hypothetical protein|tara:strand:- start:92 stop:205 length:114 start_codon:yes stop_codon:yes gene_type:complete